MYSIDVYAATDLYASRIYSMNLTKPVYSMNGIHFSRNKIISKTKPQT